MNFDREQLYSIHFWIFLLLLIIAVPSAVFALYQFLLVENLRQSLQNHSIVALISINLAYQLTEISCLIYYFRYFKTFSATPAFHLVWGYIDWAVFTLQYILYAWITIERHILIFHSQLFSTCRKRLFFHYLPPILLTIYSLLYYTIIFFGTTCENDFENILTPSLFPCVLENKALMLYETMAHLVMPTFIVVISSIFLMIRIFWQKYRMKHQFQWHGYRVMAIQVLSVSFLFLIFPFPYIVIILLQLVGFSSD